MNLKEGMRRLGLVLGFIGASTGAVFAFIVIKESHERNVNIAEYREAVSSYAVKAELAKWDGLKMPKSFRPDDAELPAFIQTTQGLKTVVFRENSQHVEVAYIEKTDGELLVDGKDTSFVEYLLLMLLPIAGFVVVWLPVRIIAWTLLGFFNSPAHPQ